MITAYNNHGQGKEALKLFEEMNKEGISPSESVFSTILSVLAEEGNLHEGQGIHEQLKVSQKASKLILISKQVKYMSNFPLSVANSLIYMYGKCGQLQHARLISFFIIFIF
jgi:pentatricopeptide repeat protein